MNETPEEFYCTNELRWQLRTVAVDKNTGQYKAYLQQMWITGTGSADEPFNVVWRDVPTVSEEE